LTPASICRAVSYGEQKGSGLDVKLALVAR